MMNRRQAMRCLGLGAVVAGGCRAVADSGRSVNVAPTTIRCAVIGGMTETGFWAALAERFHRSSGHTLEVVASGPKRVLVEALRAGWADLITMHASDTIINLVADGWAVDPQPWLRNDLLIVGPAGDPARLRGLSDAAEALRRVRRSAARFLVHASLGAQEVLREALADAGVELSAGQTHMLMHDPGRRVLAMAAELQAYTLVGRIPFLGGKMPNPGGLEVMVGNDPRLCRPYVVAVANERKLPLVRFAAARELAAYLRTEATQRWIAEFGRGIVDERPLFRRIAPEGLAG